MVAVVVLVALALPASAAERVSATVVEVIDGDTLRVNTPGCYRCRVRLTDIDAPEQDQPYGPQASRMLSHFVGGAGEMVTLVTEGRDRYGRILAEVIHAGFSVNSAMVRWGGAYVYERYADSPELDAVQATAREAALGVWALTKKERIHPWVWRHGGQKLNESVEKVEWGEVADEVDDVLEVIAAKAKQWLHMAVAWLRD